MAVFRGDVRQAAEFCRCNLWGGDLYEADPYPAYDGSIVCRSCLRSFCPHYFGAGQRKFGFGKEDFK